MNSERIRIGHVYINSSGHGVSTFEFIIDGAVRDQVKVGDVVTTGTDEFTVTGVITDMRLVGRNSSPLIAASVIPDDTLMPLVSEQRDVLVATVQVFSSAHLRPAPGGPVFAGTHDSVDALCGRSSLAHPIAAGVVDLPGGALAPICVDADELLGPLAGHLIIGGRSGAAAKTSFVTVLARSAMAAMNSQGVSCAALMFNVKGPDLLALDKPAPAAALTADDRAAYAAMGTPPAPFEHVNYYAPSTAGGYSTVSARVDARMIRWGLKDTWPYLSYLDSRLTDSDNAFSLTLDLGDRKVHAGQDSAKSLNEVCQFLRAEIESAQDASRTEIFGNHHIATARKVLRALEGLPVLTKGLVSKERVVDSDVPVTFHDGEVAVVDVAELEPRVQAAVIARTISRLLKQVTAGGLGVDRLIVFFDELNVFAPASGGEVPRSVRDLLAKLAATGRYARVSLWGAAQFPSGVFPQIRDNAGTLVLGAVADSELDSGVYGKLPAGVREQMVTQGRGSAMIRSANLRSWTPIRFPRPAWAAGLDSMNTASLNAAGRSAGLPSVSTAGFAALTEGLDPETVEHIVAAADGDDHAAVAALEKAREPDMQRIAPEPSSVYDPGDWGLDD